MNDDNAQFVQHILRNMAKRDEKDEPYLIAICGAADLGKSHLCNEWVEELSRQKKTAAHLTLDSYLIPRAERQALGISGYHIQAYGLHSIKMDLKSLQNGYAIKINGYDHQSGRAIGVTKVIDPYSVILIDGVHAMHSDIISYMDLSIFVHTSDSQLQQIRHEADQTKRNQSMLHSLGQADIELQRYKTNIAPYQHQADCTLELQTKWRYLLKCSSVNEVRQ